MTPRPEASAAAVAIIIVNWKVRELLRACLTALAVQLDAGRRASEVIVVDNDSRDGSVEMLRAEFPHVRLLANASNLGFGAANNQAFALTAAPRIVLLNPDTLVRDDALGKMLDVLEAEPEVAIVGCRLLNADGSLQRWTAGAFPSLANVASHNLLLDRLLPRALRPAPLYLDSDVALPRDVGWVSGACMAIRREALGGRLFDPRFFMYAEDMELCRRMHDAGWRVRYEPRASIVHYQGASLQQQRAEVMLSSLKGPRLYFEMVHGRAAAVGLDALTMLGFGLRWAAYRAAAIVRPAAGYCARAASSRLYLGMAWHVARDALRRSAS